MTYRLFLYTVYSRSARPLRSGALQHARRRKYQRKLDKLYWLGGWASADRNAGQERQAICIEAQHPKGVPVNSNIRNYWRLATLLVAGLAVFALPAEAHDKKSSGEVIIKWNQLAQKHIGGPPFGQARMYAMVHVAMADAVVAIQGQYTAVSRRQVGAAGRIGRGRRGAGRTRRAVRVDHSAGFQGCFGRRARGRSRGDPARDERETVSRSARR